jgi:hypothetical protein
MTIFFLIYINKHSGIAYLSHRGVASTDAM